MSRVDHWENRLMEFIEEARERPFEWGTFDCALYACECVRVLTGKHPAPEFIGAYDDEEGAREALRRLGNGTLVKTFDAHFKRVPTSHAKRGDLIYARKAVGVCIGGKAAFLIDPIGLEFIGRAEWEIAWGVG